MEATVILTEFQGSQFYGVRPSISTHLPPLPCPVGCICHHKCLHRSALLPMIRRFNWDIEPGRRTRSPVGLESTCEKEGRHWTIPRQGTRGPGETHGATAITRSGTPAAEL